MRALSICTLNKSPLCSAVSRAPSLAHLSSVGPLTRKYAWDSEISDMEQRAASAQFPFHFFFFHGHVRLSSHSIETSRAPLFRFDLHRRVGATRMVQLSLLRNSGSSDAYCQIYGLAIARCAVRSLLPLQVFLLRCRTAFVAKRNIYCREAL